MNVFRQSTYWREFSTCDGVIGLLESLGLLSDKGQHRADEFTAVTLTTPQQPISGKFRGTQMFHGGTCFVIRIVRGDGTSMHRSWYIGAPKCNTVKVEIQT